MLMLRQSMVIFGLLTVLTGVAFPLAITGLSRLAFSSQAEGSLVYDGNQVAGSSLIGQSFTDPTDFWSRPSATGPAPYNAAASSGSNLGPSNPALVTAVQERVAALHAADPEYDAPIPVDLVTASASGLDPHISPAAALYQVHRVARTTGLNEARVRELVAQFTEGRTLGLLGEPRVNVLLLNRALHAARE